MASPLPNPVNNLSEEIHKIKCKYGHNKKKKIAELSISITTALLNTYTSKMI